MKIGILGLLLTLAAVAVNADTLAPSPPSITGRIDQLFAEWNKTNSPGCGLAISQNGAIVYERGYGMANLELGVPITTESVFPAASISKQFTAACILLLAQHGQLSLDDEVWKFVPEWIDRENRITIRHLLTHTSGVREAFSLIGIAAPREDGISVNDLILRALARQRGLNFKPGTEFQYNNGGYNLLGSIVKRVSGKSLRAFAEEGLFKPLGMTHTHFHDDPTTLVPNRVTGYSRAGDGFKLARPEGGIVGNAGLFTTARDLLSWEQNFVDHKVIQETLLAEMQKPAIPTYWGDGSSYGFGLSIGTYRGLRTIGHGGGDPGIATYVVRYPDQGLAVTVLGNIDEVMATALTQRIADIYLERAFTNSSQIPAAVSAPSEKIVVPAQELANKAGLYLDVESDVIGRIFVRDGKLRASQDDGEENSIELVALNQNRFAIPGTEVIVEFVPGSNDRAQETHVRGIGPKTRISRRLAPYKISHPDLKKFAGQYHGAEIETTYTVILLDTDLLLKMPGRSDTILRPVFKDGFSGFGTTRFSRDKRGRIDGFTVNLSGVRGLRFDRVP